MLIELKRLQIVDRLSEETICFTADLIINGVKVGTAENHGHGGNTIYHPTYNNDHHKQLVKDAEEYCTSLPPLKFGKELGGGTYPNSLEHQIDEIVYKADADKQLAKFHKKMERDMIKSIVVGVKGGTSYRTYTFRKPIAEVITIGGMDYMQKQIDQILTQLKGDEEVLNTNLPKQLCTTLS